MNFDIKLQKCLFLEAMACHMCTDCPCERHCLGRTASYDGGQLMSAAVILTCSFITPEIQIQVFVQSDSTISSHVLINISFVLISVDLLGSRHRNFVEF